MCVWVKYVCTFWIYTFTFLCTYSLRPSCWSPASVGFKAKNERHRLQISPWLPAPELETDTFPAAFVELCYLLALNQLLSHALIFRNRPWYTIPWPRQTHSQALKNYPTSHSIRLLSWKEEFAVGCEGNQTLLSDKTLRICANISKVLKLVFRPLVVSPSSSRALECCENPIRWALLPECHNKTLHDSNHMNSLNGIFETLLSHCVYSQDRVIGKQISIQNVFFSSTLNVIGTQHNNGFFSNLCCGIQKWMPVECLIAGGGKIRCYYWWWSNWQFPKRHTSKWHISFLYSSVSEEVFFLSELLCLLPETVCNIDWPHCEVHLCSAGSELCC